MIAVPALALPFVIRAAVVEGIATATEVSTIGIAYAVLAGLLIYRRFEWRRLKPMLVDTAALSGAILLIIGAATSMAWALTQSGFSGQLAADDGRVARRRGDVHGGVDRRVHRARQRARRHSRDRAVRPAACSRSRARWAFNDVHYAMVVILSMGVGLFAPPFGVGYYSACAISRINPDEGMKPIVGYIAALMVGLIVVAAVPWISTGLPALILIRAALTRACARREFLSLTDSIAAARFRAASRRLLPCRSPKSRPALNDSRHRTPRPYSGTTPSEPQEQASTLPLADAIRFLAIDAIVRAGEGHQGVPLGMAEIATALFTRHLKFNPADPQWPDRDRFVLSNGHGSMLLYALLHLTGYPHFGLDALKSFREMGSHCAGHPEYDPALGIEVTTGPLGQGIANAFGMAVAEAYQSARFGDGIVDHYTYAFVGDGCLQEGIGQEMISLAGHLQLGKLILCWDDNQITDDGSHLALDQRKTCVRAFASRGWHVIEVDGHDLEAVSAALVIARADPRPSMIACRTVIASRHRAVAGAARRP